MQTWETSFNLAGHETGKVRSILGYAGESLVIGRALAAGFNLFFKAWRDSPYDAVLEHDGVLCRIEIKQSREGEQLSLTGGGRSGQQINRSAGSRERVVSADDCDVLIGVHSLSGRCWIVPTEVIEILNRKSINVDAFRDFDEAWHLIIRAQAVFPTLGLRTRLREMPEERLHELAVKVGATMPAPNELRFGKRSRIRVDSETDRLALEIWRTLARPGDLGTDNPN